MGLKLMAEVGLDGSGFERGLHRMVEEAAASVKNLAVSAFGLYGIEEAISKTVESATSLVNESKRLGIPIEQLQIMSQAAHDAGTDIETLATSMEKLNSLRSRAQGKGPLGTKSEITEARSILSKFNISAGDSRSAIDLIMGPIADKVRSSSPDDIVGPLRDALGRGAGALIPTLKTDFGELSDKMHKLGSIIDAETAVKLKALGDNFDLLKNIMAANLGPVLLIVVEGLLQFIGKIKEVGAYLGVIFSGGAVNAAKDFAKAKRAQITVDSLDRETAGGQFVLTGKAKQDYDKAKAVLDEYNKKQAEAGQAAVEQGDAWKKMIDDLRQKLADEANALTHPKDIAAAIETPADKSNKSHIEKAQTDSLVRVGNFLGSNGNTISRVDQKKIDLLTKIADNTKPKGTFDLGGNFFGIPML